MSINGLLNQQITIASKTGYNAYGREIIGTTNTVDARFQKTHKEKLSPTGTSIIVVAIAYVPPATIVVIDDKVSYDGADYKVYGIYEAVDGTGRKNHLRLELTEWATK